MRCQAIKRDGNQCNYNARPMLQYCGHHRTGTMINDARDTLILPSSNISIDFIMEIMGVTRTQAVDIYIEDLEIQRKISIDKQINSMINSFKSLDIPEENCSICISIPEILVKTPCCKKEFCKDCLKKWISVKKNCPACREILS